VHESAIEKLKNRDPIAFLNRRADALAQRSADLKKLADAWEPLHAFPSSRFACVLIDPRQCMTKPAGDHWPATGNVKAKDMDIDRFGSVVVAPALVAILIFIYFIYQRSLRIRRRLVMELLEGYFQGDVPADQLGKRARMTLH